MRKKKWLTSYYVPTVIDVGAPWYLAGGIAAANCLAAYKAIGAADLAASYVNLANPGTYDITASAAPTFAAATGWTFDGASQWLITGKTIVNDARNYSMLARFSGVTGSTGYMCGFYIATPWSFTMTPNRTAARRYFNGGAALAVAAVSASGVIGIAGDQAYIDGAVDGTITTGTGTTNMPIFIGANANNEAGARHTYFAGNIQAFVIYDAILTPAQVIAVTNAMAALPPP
jgi:hypothetical protein